MSKSGISTSEKKSDAHKRILVIGESYRISQLCTLLEKVLSMPNVTIQYAKSSKAAVKLIVDYSFSLVLNSPLRESDINMVLRHMLASSFIKVRQLDESTSAKDIGLWLHEAGLLTVTDYIDI